MKWILLVLGLIFSPMAAYAAPNMTSIMAKEYIYQAQGLIGQKRYDDAKTILIPIMQDVTLDPKVRGDAYFYLANCNFPSDTKIGYLQQALSLGTTDDSLVYYLIAEAQYEQGKIDESINNINHAIHNRNSKHVAKFYKLLAQCYIKKKDWYVALSNADSAVAKNGNDIESYYLRGIAAYNLLIQGKNKECLDNAINDFDMYLRNGKDDVQKLNSAICKGRLYERIHKTREAIRSFEDAARLTKDQRQRNRLRWRIESLHNALSWNS